MAELDVGSGLGLGHLGGKAPRCRTVTSDPPLPRQGFSSRFFRRFVPQVVRPADESRMRGTQVAESSAASRDFFSGRAPSHLRRAHLPRLRSAHDVLTLPQDTVRALDSPNRTNEHAQCHLAALRRRLERSRSSQTRICHRLSKPLDRIPAGNSLTQALE